MVMDIMHKKVFEKIIQNSPDGAMTYKTFYQYMSWRLKYDKKECKQILGELKDMGLIELGQKGFKIMEKGR